MPWAHDLKPRHTHTGSHGFSFLVLSFEGVSYISVASLGREIRGWEARWDDWFEKSTILLVKGYFWLSALRKFILLYKQLFDFICRASRLVCNALKEVGYSRVSCEMGTRWKLLWVWEMHCSILHFLLRHSLTLFDVCGCTEICFWAFWKRKRRIWRGEKRIWKRDSCYDLRPG